MIAHIFAEGSGTTADARDKPVKEYYEGLFDTVSGLHDNLSELSDAHLHVLSEEYGIARGVEKISVVSPDEEKSAGIDTMAERAKVELLQAASDADVMVILLSNDVFQRTVEEVWDELVGAAKPKSIWCIGVARSSLEGLDIEGLEEKGCRVLTYQRVGVARIGSETREELLEAVEQKTGHQ
jgi:hypothetical protein